MALTWTITKDAVQDDVSSFHLTDLTPDYGLNGNPSRDERANFLFVTKTDKNGARVLLPVTLDDSDPLVTSAWDVLISLDGLVEKILFSLTLFSISQTYNQGDIFYNTSDGKVYKTKNNGTIGHTAPNSTYYTLLNVSDLYASEINNASPFMQVVILNDLITGRIEDDIVEAREDETDVFLNGKYDLAFSKADYLDSMLEGANAALANERQYEAEEIIRGIDNYLQVAA